MSWQRVRRLAVRAVLFVAVLAPTGASAQDDVTVWTEFVRALRAGEITADALRPIDESWRQPWVGFLQTMRAKAVWQEWERRPEVRRVGPLLHFVIPLTFDGRTSDYCFTFVREHDRWFFRHAESIVIRLDRLPALPTSTFPDLPEDRKAWMRQENYWSQMVNLFRTMVELSGRKAAFDIFLDGRGYLLQAASWVPFVEPSRAFILYACWEQSRLQGNPVALERLADDEAVMRLEPIFFRLYEDTTHLRGLISRDDYRRIFETIWEDRARAAGWTVAIACDGARCTLRFTRPRTPSHD
jgi:hypothetical protein